MSQYIVQGIFAVAGIIALLAAILNWNWFFTARNTQCRAAASPLVLRCIGCHPHRNVHLLFSEYAIGYIKTKIADKATLIRDFPILLIQTILRPKIPHTPFHLAR